MLENHFNLWMIIALHLIIQFKRQYKQKLHSLVYYLPYIFTPLIFARAEYGQRIPDYGI